MFLRGVSAGVLLDRAEEEAEECYHLLQEVGSRTQFHEEHREARSLQDGTGNSAPTLIHRC